MTPYNKVNNSKYFVGAYCFHLQDLYFSLFLKCRDMKVEASSFFETFVTALLPAIYESSYFVNYCQQM
jgi:hypothetical protein